MLKVTTKTNKVSVTKEIGFVIEGQKIIIPTEIFYDLSEVPDELYQVILNSIIKINEKQ